MSLNKELKLRCLHLEFVEMMKGYSTISNMHSDITKDIQIMLDEFEGENIDELGDEEMTILKMDSLFHRLNVINKQEELLRVYIDDLTHEMQKV